MGGGPLVSYFTPQPPPPRPPWGFLRQPSQRLCGRGPVETILLCREIHHSPTRCYPVFHSATLSPYCFNLQHFYPLTLSHNHFAFTSAPRLPTNLDLGIQVSAQSSYHAIRHCAPRIVQPRQPTTTRV